MSNLNLWENYYPGEPVRVLRLSRDNPLECARALSDMLAKRDPDMIWWAITSGGNIILYSVSVGDKWEGEMSEYDTIPMGEYVIIDPTSDELYERMSEEEFQLYFATYRSGEIQ